MNYILKIKINLFACLLLLLAVGEGLCQGAVEKTAVGLEIKPDTSENVVTTDSDPVEVIRKAYKNLWTNTLSYRTRTVITSPGGMSTIEKEQVAPDRYRSVDVETGWEAIVVAGDTYIKESASAEWKKINSNSRQSESTVFLDKQRFDDAFKSMRISRIQFKAVGPETLNGIPTMVYQSGETRTALRGEKINSTTKIWVGVRDNLLYKEEYESSELDSKGKLYNAKVTEDFYDYNDEIKIEPPI